VEKHTLFLYAEHFNFNVVISLDADGRYDPSEGRVDIVTGLRYVKEIKIVGMPVCRRIRLKVLSLFAGRRRIKNPQSGLRAYAPRR